jgi:hypothetical protein
MCAKSLSVILFVLAIPFVFGQMCVSEPESPVIDDPVAESPVVPPADPITTPSVIVPLAVVPPVVVPPIITPPVVVPPVTPPVPPAWQPKIFESLEVPIKSSQRTLSAEEIDYVWLYPCNGVIGPNDVDEYGPDPTLLRVDDYGPIASYHDIFCWFEADDDLGQPKTVLLNLFCLDNSSDGSDAAGIEISRVTRTWDSAAVFEGPWQAYCAPESSFSDYLGSYEPNGPSINEWYSLDITEPYQKWFSGEWENFGLMLEQGGWWNRFTSFASAQYPDETKRPWLLTYHEPALQLKLPLPGGKAWILTCAAGEGGHTGNSYYSLDFSYSSAVMIDGKAVATTETDVPVLASAAGVVIAAKEDDEKSPNGGYVKIKHQPEGCVTCYLHLKPSSLKVKVGDFLAEGAQLGLMGTTGNSTGVHVHFEVQWTGKETEVTVEGRTLGDFNVGSGHNYYQSTNTP